MWDVGVPVVTCGSKPHAHPHAVNLVSLHLLQALSPSGVEADSSMSAGGHVRGLAQDVEY